MMHTNQFNTIEEALEDFRQGKPIIVADDEDRENEGDLICSAQFVTPELINFITKEISIKGRNQYWPNKENNSI